MKTLTLLACICALSACFSPSEGRKKPWKIHHKKNNVQQLTLDRQLLLHPKLPPNWNTLIKRHLIFGPPKYPKPSHPIRRKPKPKHPQPPRCPAKNNTVANNSSSGATTQIPSLRPTTLGVTPIHNTTTVSVTQTNTNSSAANPSPQPSAGLSDTTAAPLTSSPALPKTTAAPPTSSLATPAPQPSPNPSPPGPTPEISKNTTGTTTQTTTPGTNQNTTVEQTTSPSSQNANSQFWQHIYELIKFISGVTPKK